MSKILELREKRAKAWDAAKAFLDAKRGGDGLNQILALFFTSLQSLHRIWDRPKLDLLEHFVDAFSDLILIPLAITNDSSINDKNISVLIKIDTNTAEIIVPGSNLINDKISGLESLIYENNYIEKLFTMPETDKIQYDSNLSFDAIEEIRRMQKTDIWGQIHYDSEDYEIELQKYIAQPTEYDNTVFEYSINNLRPKETKWLGASIFVKPLSSTVKLSYLIKSSNSNGELDGEIIIEI